LKKLKKIFTVDKVSQNMACRPPIASWQCACGPNCYFFPVSPSIHAHRPQNLLL
jgi:hypothetical protein